MELDKKVAGIAVCVCLTEGVLFTFTEEIHHQVVPHMTQMAMPITSKRYIAFYRIIVIDGEWHVLANNTD